MLSDFVKFRVDTDKDRVTAQIAPGTAGSDLREVVLAEEAGQPRVSLGIGPDGTVTEIRLDGLFALLKPKAKPDA